jgi:hypothetical protein
LHGWSDAKCEPVADKIVAILARYAPNIPNAIEHRQVLAPPDLEARFGLVGGHIFHGELFVGRSTSIVSQRERRYRTLIFADRERTPADASAAFPRTCSSSYLA